MLGLYSKSEEAAKLIWNCWKKGETIKQLPFELRPQNREEGYAIQAHFKCFSGQPFFV